MMPFGSSKCNGTYLWMVADAAASVCFSPRVINSHRYLIPYYTKSIPPPPQRNRIPVYTYQKNISESTIGVAEEPAVEWSRKPRSSSWLHPLYGLALERPDPASASSTRAGGHHRRSLAPSFRPHYRSARVVVPAPGLAVLPCHCHERTDIDDREVPVERRSWRCMATPRRLGSTAKEWRIDFLLFA